MSGISCSQCGVYYDPARWTPVCAHHVRLGQGETPFGHCKFCGALTEQRCTWPAEGLVRAAYRDLVAGDRVKRTKESEAMAKRPAALVEQIGECGYEAYRHVTLRIGKREKRFTVMASSRVMVVRPAPCGAFACDLHHRELGEKSFVCKDHWNEWEQRSAV